MYIYAYILHIYITRGDIYIYIIYISYTYIYTSYIYIYIYCIDQPSAMTRLFIKLNSYFPMPRQHSTKG